MNIKELLIGKDICACGMAHKCPIEHVIIGENACASLPSITKAYANILLVADTNTYRVCGKDVARILESKIADTLVYEREGILVPNETAIDELTARVTADTDLIIGVVLHQNL